ncbi:MAG: hypothetical protein J6S60_09275 [Oscillospiraceae bacterium]|nr:hypothetical protein [Oscillospiraceae bacterium]
MKREDVIQGLKCCLPQGVAQCGQCPYFPKSGCDTRLLADALALMADADCQAEAEPHVLTRDELIDWTGDVWAEDAETGVVTAIDRSAVKAYRRYMRLDADSPKRLWSGRPREAQREETPWTT